VCRRCEQKLQVFEKVLTLNPIWDGEVGGDVIENHLNSLLRWQSTIVGRGNEP
jgi:hypothetical protein